jgi:hypothetical protein
MVVTVLCAREARPAEEDALAAAAGALSARARDGQPSYQETVAWLSSVARAHSRVTFSMGGVGVATAFEIQPTPYGCVLGLLRTSRNLTTGLSVGGAFLLALREVSRGVVLPVDGQAWCTDLKGSERMILPLKNSRPGREPRLTPGAPISTFRVCFDTSESAERATQALRHAAELCGAREPI